LFAQTGTWKALKNLPPHANNGVCLLMTDGSVICKSTSGPGNGTGWDRLRPDAHGSYINGTWDTIHPMNYDRLFFSTQVLPSGKVYVAGGEYGPGGTRGEVYDPVTNTWTKCDTIPKGWNIYDGNSEILYNGTVLEGPQIGSYNSYNILLWSPITYKYTVGPLSNYNHDEAEWIKLPDSTVLFVGRSNTGTSRYSPQTGTWAFDASTPGQIYDPFGQEAGCALMLPNGKAIFFGATPYNCIYTPSGKHNVQGSWVSADSFPKINGTYVGQTDASGAMMVNGHILLAASPIGTGPNTEFNSPAYFLEYDYTTNKFTQVKAKIPGQGGDSVSYIASYQTQMLDLPDGNVLVSISQTDTVVDQYYIYTPAGAPIPQGKPTINNVIPLSCTSYKITGKLFNGISEGAAYGDDWQMSTNYPIVRLTNGTNVYYAKTSNWNRIGAVQTDSLEDTAYFTIPAIPNGTYSLVVAVNGFASNPVLFTTFGVSVTAQNILCNGENNGSATALGSNGVSPYTYLWNPGGQTTAPISGLSAGIYTVMVMPNGGGCSASATVTITQPTVLTGTMSAPNNVPCYGETGSDMVTAAGGTSPYTYSWAQSGGTNATGTGLTAGTYTVTISDHNGCTATAITTITQPQPLTATVVASNIVCYGGTGSAMSTATGGTSPYNYLWTPTGGTNATGTGLTAGAYTVTISDQNGCTVTGTVTLTQPTALAAIGDGNAIGTGWVDVSGGTMPYTYLWPNGSTTDSIFGQKTGQYCCKITDANGCIDTFCVYILNTTGIDNLKQTGGAITVYPNPGNGNFTIMFSHPVSPQARSGYQTIEVYNVLGEKVYSNYQITKSSNHQIDLSSQPNGIYFYRVLNSEDGSLLGEGKLIIEK